MSARNILIASCAVMVLGTGIAQAGPCTTANKDAGSGPTPGHTGQTVGTATPRTDEHPPAGAMNRETGNVAASSQDAQKQMQNKPTAAQEAQGAPSKSASGNDC